MIASTNDAYCPTLRAVTKTGTAGGRELGARDRAQRPRRRRDRQRDAGGHRRGVPRGRARRSRAGNYGGKLGPASLPSAQDHGDGRRVSDEIVLTLKAQPASCGGRVGAPGSHSWTDLPASAIVALASASGRARAQPPSATSSRSPASGPPGSGWSAISPGSSARRGAGRRRGRDRRRRRAGCGDPDARRTIAVSGNAGRGAGLAMAGGLLDIGGNAGPRAGGCGPGATTRHDRRRAHRPRLRRRRGRAPACAAGWLWSADARARARAGHDRGHRRRVRDGGARPRPVVEARLRRSARLGHASGDIPYACTYRPQYLRPAAPPSRDDGGCRSPREHLTGSYRRYSGDLAELGAGEILEWTAN